LRDLNFSFLSWLTYLCKSGIKQSRPQNLNDAIRLAVELETFDRAERRVAESRSYLHTTAADSTAGKVSDKTKDQTDIKVSNSTASRIASFKFWGRDCLMRILISESARASIKC
jgi:hypothetical protein